MTDQSFADQGVHSAMKYKFHRRHHKGPKSRFTS